MLRGEHIMSCPNCQRLIVWRDDFLADDPEALAAAKAKEKTAPARLNSFH